jgi:hypothetical protein
MGELQAIDPRWLEAEQNKAGAEFASLQSGVRAILETSIAFHDPRIVFPAGEFFATRLGARDLLVHFAEPALGPFGREVSNFTLAVYWLRGLDLSADVTPLLTERFEGGFLFTVQGRDFRYDAKGLSLTL